MRRTSVILNSAHQKAKMWLLVHRNKVVLLAAAAAGTCYVVKVRRKSILTTRGATIAVLACWVWACISSSMHLYGIVHTVLPVQVCLWVDATLYGSFLSNRTGSRVHSCDP